MPQVSCLVPLLFRMYINDLPHAIQTSEVSMHADYISLSYQTSDRNNLNNAINNDVMEFDTWLKGSKLSLNITHCLLVATEQKHSYLKNRNENLYLTIRSKELEVIQKK